MNARLPPAEAEAHVDLEERILRVERRLMAREDRLRRGAASLGVQLRERLQPRRLLPVGGALLAAAGLWMLWRRPAAAGAPAEPQPPARPRLPWLQLIGLALPLLPPQWRARLGPGAAPNLVALALPLVQALLKPRPPGAPLQTVAAVDLERLAGRWYLVGELPAPPAADRQAPPEIALLPRDDGGFDLLQRRGGQVSEARLQALPGSQGSRLRTSHWPALLHWLPQAWTEQGVLHVGPDYDEALIGSTARDSLWLLSRQPALAPARREALMQLARERGFDVDPLHVHAAP